MYPFACLPDRKDLPSSNPTGQFKPLTAEDFNNHQCFGNPVKPACNNQDSFRYIKNRSCMRNIPRCAKMEV